MTRNFFFTLLLELIVKPIAFLRLKFGTSLSSRTFFAHQFLAIEFLIRLGSTHHYSSHYYCPQKKKSKTMIKQKYVIVSIVRLLDIQISDSLLLCYFLLDYHFVTFCFLLTVSDSSNPYFLFWFIGFSFFSQNYSKSIPHCFDPLVLLCFQLIFRLNQHDPPILYPTLHWHCHHLQISTLSIPFPNFFSLFFPQKIFLIYQTFHFFLNLSKPDTFQFKQISLFLQAFNQMMRITPSCDCQLMVERWGFLKIFFVFLDCYLILAQIT